jgi:hypothetical protein
MIIVQKYIPSDLAKQNANFYANPFYIRQRLSYNQLIFYRLYSFSGLSFDLTYHLLEVYIILRHPNLLIGISWHSGFGRLIMFLGKL